jgi:hypothetical protein
VGGWFDERDSIDTRQRGFGGKRRYLGFYLTEKETFQTYKGAVNVISDIILNDYKDEDDL